jgi:hypothetical protein
VTYSSICHLTNSSRPEIEERLAQLSGACSLERALVASATAGALVGILLGALASRWWLLPAGFLQVFTLQLAALGWCPLVPLFRYWGFRSLGELEQERYALKLLRGDFHQVIEALQDQSADAEYVLDAVRN